MPLDADPFITDLRATLAAALPEVSEITEIEHLSRLAWADLTMPYIGIMLSQFQAWADQPADTNIFECQCEIWYVLASTGSSSGLRPKLETIVDLFYPTDPSTLGHGQVLEVMGFDYSDELMPNQVFVGANHSARAGVVRLRCLVGEGP